MKKTLFSNIVFVTSLTIMFVLTGSCSRKCPAYPRDECGVMPVNLQDRTLIYVSDTDTVKMYCGRPNYSGKHKIRYGMRCGCGVNATQEVGSDVDNIYYINEFQLCSDEEILDTYHVSVSIEAFGISKEWSCISSQEGGLQNGICTYVEKLVQWRGETDRLYETVYKVWNDEEVECLYLAPGEGLVQIDMGSGKLWTLR